MNSTKKSKNPYDIEDDDDFEEKPTTDKKVELNQRYKEDEIIEKINLNNDDPRIANRISQNESKTPPAKEQESFCKKCVCLTF